jgi:AcrR family transcriptional regulator
MPKAFTEKEKEWIRERLLEEGDQQFAAYGLRKTNVEELATAAGISKGAFYIFYESKEALFMDVIERAEQHFRQEVLAAIDLPGPSPRARLLAVLKRAFGLLKTMPILQFLTGSDYDRLFRRVPAERVQEHLASDRVFIQELITRCQKAGIPIQAGIEEISGLLYALVLTILHEDDFGPAQFSGTTDLLLELVAAFCLGEVEMQYQKHLNLPSVPERDRKHEPDH